MNLDERGGTVVFNYDPKTRQQDQKDTSKSGAQQYPQVVHHCHDFLQLPRSDIFAVMSLGDSDSHELLGTCQVWFQC